MADTITIQHIAGCPNAALARERVDEAVGRLRGAAPTVNVDEIADQAEAERRGSLGSPTVLIDGIDRLAHPAELVAFACRVYTTDGRTDGAPSVQQILDALTVGEGSPHSR